MAEEGTRSGDDVGAATGKKPSKGRSTITLLVVVSAVVMILTPLITILVVRSLSQKKAQTVQKLDTVELPLPKVQVNVAETNGTRYAQIDVVVELSGSDVLPYFENQTAQNTHGQLRRMMSSIISIISSKELDGLLTSEAKETLAAEIREALNEHLRSVEARGLVTDVYFCGFLIQ